MLCLTIDDKYTMKKVVITTSIAQRRSLMNCLKCPMIIDCAIENAVPQSLDCFIHKDDFQREKRIADVEEERIAHKVFLKDMRRDGAGFQI